MLILSHFRAGTTVLGQENPCRLRLLWDELEATQCIEFQAKLSAALEAGRRPVVGPAEATAHPQHVALMAKCWAGDPHARPTFEMINGQLPAHSLRRPGGAEH